MSIVRKNIEFDTLHIVTIETSQEPRVGFFNHKDLPHGWKYDIKRWNSPFDSKLPSLIKRTDPSFQGLTKDYFKSGVGSIKLEDLKVNEISEIKNNGISNWIPSINNGSYYRYNMDYFCYSDNSIVKHFNLLDGLELRLDEKPNLTTPISATIFKRNLVTKSIDIYKKFLQVTKFTGIYENEIELETLDSANEVIWDNVDTSKFEFLVSNNISDQSRLIFNKEFVKQVGTEIVVYEDLGACEIVGVSNGHANQIFLLEYFPVLVESDFHLYLATINSYEEWTLVDSFKELEGTSKSYFVDKDLGILYFGDTLNGGIPISGQYIVVSYNTAVRIEFEPLDQSKILLPVEADVSPATQIQNQGFICITHELLEPINISLSIDKPLISGTEYGPIYTGSDYAILKARVNGINDISIRNKEVTFTLNPSLGSLQEGNTATSFTNGKGEAFSSYIPPIRADELGYYSSLVRTCPLTDYPNCKEIIISDPSNFILGKENEIVTFQISSDDPYLGTNLDDFLLRLFNEDTPAWVVDDDTYAQWKQEIIQTYHLKEYVPVSEGQKIGGRKVVLYKVNKNGSVKGYYDTDGDWTSYRRLVTARDGKTIYHGGDTLYRLIEDKFYSLNSTLFDSHVPAPKQLASYGSDGVVFQDNIGPYHFFTYLNGTLTDIDIPASSLRFTSIISDNSNNVYALGALSTARSYKYDGTWHDIGIPEASSYTEKSIIIDGSVYVGVNSTIYYYDTSWHTYFVHVRPIIDFLVRDGNIVILDNQGKVFKIVEGSSIQLAGTTSASAKLLLLENNDLYVFKYGTLDIYKYVDEEDNWIKLYNNYISGSVYPPEADMYYCQSGNTIFFFDNTVHSKKVYRYTINYFNKSTDDWNVENPNNPEESITATVVYPILIEKISDEDDDYYGKYRVVYNAEALQENILSQYGQIDSVNTLINQISHVAMASPSDNSFLMYSVHHYIEAVPRTYLITDFDEYDEEGNWTPTQTDLENDTGCKEWAKYKSNEIVTFNPDGIHDHVFRFDGTTWTDIGPDYTISGQDFSGSRLITRGDEVFAISGTGSLNRNYAFRNIDGTYRDTWENISNIGISLPATGAVLFNDEIYCSAGDGLYQFTGGGGPIKWTKVVTTTDSRGIQGIIVFNDEIWMYQDNNYIESWDGIDLTDRGQMEQIFDTQETLNNYPIFCLLGNKLYCNGNNYQGTPSGTLSENIYCYIEDLNEWRKVITTREVSMNAGCATALTEFNGKLVWIDPYAGKIFKYTNLVDETITRDIVGYWLVTDKILNFRASCWSSYYNRDIQSNIIQTRLKLPDYMTGVYLTNEKIIPYGWRLISSDLDASSGIDGATFITINPEE